MCLFAVARQRQFAHQQITRAFQHLLLAERQTLRLFQDQEVLQYRGDFQERSGSHPVRIFLEPVFPVSVTSAFAVRQELQYLLDLSVFHHRAESYRLHAVERYGDF